MSEPARNRFALDLEDLERQLRAAGQAPRPGQSADPLAELTRIVGQDDPLRDIFAHRGQAPGAPRPVQGHAASPAQASPAQAQAQTRPAARQEPSFDAAESYRPEPAAAAAPPAELRGALDEFEALLRRPEAPRPAPAATPDRAVAYAAPHEQDFDRHEPQPHGRPASVQGVTTPPRDLDEEAGGYAEPAYPYGYDQAEPPEHMLASDDDLPELEPRRSRRGLWTAGALLVVGLVGVGAAMSLRSPSTTDDGQPPTIAADQGPMKVEPANPGGAEIPNQNKQIYERAGEAPKGQTKVVSREEQPVDVQQAARSMPSRVVVPGAGPAGAPAAGNPLAQAPAAPMPSITPPESLLTPVPPVPGLGEPRRVRTVAIRPDGSPATAPMATASADGPLATGSAPARPNGAAAANPSPPISTAQPRPRPAAAPEPPKAQERVAMPPAATTPSAPTRLANAAPAAPAPAPAAAAAVPSGSGDFTVQLAAPGSESEARATFAALQRKYPGQLGGHAPIVKKTELAGGKTVYRLRVGPYSRDDAATMCTQLQAAGGQCFIAKN
jgi:cell division septation protein DedD